MTPDDRAAIPPHPNSAIEAARALVRNRDAALLDATWKLCKAVLAEVAAQLPGVPLTVDAHAMHPAVWWREDAPDAVLIETRLRPERIGDRRSPQRWVWEVTVTGEEDDIDARGDTVREALAGIVAQGDPLATATVDALLAEVKP